MRSARGSFSAVLYCRAMDVAWAPAHYSPFFRSPFTRIKDFFLRADRAVGVLFSAVIASRSICGVKGIYVVLLWSQLSGF